MPGSTLIDGNLVVPDRFRTGKAYTIALAAKLARTTPATVQRWLVGYEASGHRMAPLFGSKRPVDSATSLVSFLELVEITVAARFRQGADGGHPVSLEKLRRAHEYAREYLGIPYPFASLRLLEDGGHVMHRFDMQDPEGPRLALDMHGQWELPGIVQHALDQVDFGQNQGSPDPFAIRWFPRGKAGKIVVDPHIAAGRPTICGLGVTVETVSRRWRNGERIQDIADDYEVEPDLIETALRFVA